MRSRYNTSACQVKDIRLITPSNLLSLGSETACRGHLVEILKSFPKSQHGLTQRTIDSRDKQNHGSIELLLKPGVDKCLSELHASHKTNGTRIYLNLTKDIKDAFLDKSIDPLCRLTKMWKSVFFFRIWRYWLKTNDCKEDSYFITNNAYLCAELNAHMLLNLVINVVQEIFPPEAQRVWCSGSQACEQLFRLLRSMTPTFSTIVNFTMKGILNRMHKLQFLSSAECDETKLFPRVKRRLLQTKEESQGTLSIPTLSDIDEAIHKAKESAIELAKACNMDINSYDDRSLLIGLEEVVMHGIENDGEDNSESENTHDTINKVTEESSQLPISTLTSEDIMTIKEDLSQVKLCKTSTAKDSLPTYGKATGAEKGRQDAMATSKGRSKFVLYNNTYIRKTTALYLAQDASQLSSDRLLRVRAVQPAHMYSSPKSTTISDNRISSGDLCLFYES